MGHTIALTLFSIFVFSPLSPPFLAALPSYRLLTLHWTNDQQESSVFHTFTSYDWVITYWLSSCASAWTALTGGMITCENHYTPFSLIYSFGICTFRTQDGSFMIFSFLGKGPKRQKPQKGECSWTLDDKSQFDIKTQILWQFWFLLGSHRSAMMCNQCFWFFYPKWRE